MVSVIFMEIYTRTYFQIKPVSPNITSDPYGSDVVVDDRARKIALLVCEVFLNSRSY